MSLDFNIALSGIRAAEMMITTAQNNIANATNTSYARQRVDVSAVDYPQGVSGIQAQMGSGVAIDQITRLKDELLIQQSRTELGNTGYYSSLEDILSNIEIIYNEVADNSISDLMLNFYNAFEEVSKYPEQNSYRLSAIYSGKMLSDKVLGVSSQLDEVKEQTDSKLLTEVNRVNTLIDKIANIHRKMENVYSTDPNALLDERDKYLDELSTYLDVQLVHKSSEMNLEIKVGNTTLLAGKNAYNIDALYVPEKDQWVLAATDMEFKPSSGSITGILETRNEIIPKYTNELNFLVSNLITEVNNIHSSGFGSDGTTGLNFFLGSDIRTIEVNSILEEEPSKLATSTELGVLGNSDISKQISELQSSTFLNGKTTTNYYQAYIIRLASELNVAAENAKIHGDVQIAIESQRQSIQGVNTDEEMTDLLMFQTYYQANAKAMTTVNKLLDHLLSII